MTDAERAALRDEIEGLTIRQARARGEQATETLRVLAELGITSGRPATNTPGPQRADIGTAIGPTPLFSNCPVCGRALGEPASVDGCALGVECPAVASRAAAPGVPKTNKGHPVGLSAEERAARLKAPAFDAKGEPLA
jgi:hypothetical protein